MIHFHYSSKQQVTIHIVDEFAPSDTERIALLLEGSLSDNFDKKVIFQVETDLPMEQMALLGNFSQRLPYESQVDLKYPLLVW